MVISVKQAYRFYLYQLVTTPIKYQLLTTFNVDTSGVQTRSVEIVSCLAIPGPNVTVPDWVSFDPLFLEAVSAGNASIIEEPTGATSITATETSSSIELPQTGSTVIVQNTDNNVPVVVALGNSVSPSSGTAIPPGSSLALPLGENTNLAAIGFQASTVLNVAVV